MSDKVIDRLAQGKRTLVMTHIWGLPFNAQTFTFRQLQSTENNVSSFDKLITLIAFESWNRLPASCETPMSLSPSTTSPTWLLDPTRLARISKMELVARQVMDGYVQGMHRSPHIGFAVDFAQHRQRTRDDVKLN